MRFGFKYVEAALDAQKRRILVVELEEVAEDMVRYVIKVMTSLGARRYGKRSAGNRARHAVTAMQSANAVSTTPRGTDRCRAFVAQVLRPHPALLPARHG